METIGAGVIGDETGSTYVSRRVDNRSLLDRLYRVRYVLPKEHVDARLLNLDLFYRNLKLLVLVVHPSLTADLSNPTQLKNVKIIKNATFSGIDTITVTTELPHRLMEGDQVKIKNVESVNNPLNTSKLVLTVNLKSIRSSPVNHSKLLELQLILVYSLTKLTREQPNSRSKIFL